MAKSKNHTSHNQSNKAHKNGAPRCRRVSPQRHQAAGVNAGFQRLGVALITCAASCRAPGRFISCLPRPPATGTALRRDTQPSSTPCAASAPRLTRRPGVPRHQEGEEGAVQQHQGGAWPPPRVICALCPTLGPEGWSLTPLPVPRSSCVHLRWTPSSCATRCVAWPQPLWLSSAAVRLSSGSRRAVLTHSLLPLSPPQKFSKKHNKVEGKA